MLKIWFVKNHNLIMRKTIFKTVPIFAVYAVIMLF